MQWFAISLGGAMGVLLRAIVLRLQRSGVSFPYMTFSVNILGSFVLGCLMAHRENEWFYFFVVVGLLGGFTIYSTFALEIIIRGQTITGKKYAFLYLFITLLGCIFAAGAGYSIYR